MEHNIALISSPILVNDLHISPPTFSRLPPDGHEGDSKEEQSKFLFSFFGDWYLYIRYKIK